MPGCFSSLIPRRRNSSQVEKEMDEKPEKSLDLPPSYSSISNEALTILEGTIDSLSKGLRALSLDIWNHPELKLEEHHTHDVLVKFMQDHGFEVKPHAYGLDTAFEATFEHKEGGRVIGFQSEMDALPGIGHACGHNLIAISGVAAALAVATALKKLNVPGKVILLGTPAEEAVGGKILLLKAGAYKEMNACLMLHPSPFSGFAPILAMSELTVDYYGRNAHAAGAPFEGINALDAAVQAYTSLGLLRQQIHPTARLHGIIKGSDEWVVNIIPAHSQLEFGIRMPLQKDLEKLKERVLNCFDAAATATGCKIEKKWLVSYSDNVNNTVMGHEYQKYMLEKIGKEWMDDPPALGSTDFGNVSYELPSIHPVFRIDVGDGEGNHTPGFTKAAKTEKSHEQTLTASKGIAVTAWRIIVDEDFYGQVKQTFDDQMKNFNSI